ncbi:MAG: PD-(D/E)XK nuclease family protein [Muribaculaceae bacterium]|nr:PD-(D/E)XK nuclease family protein [Muribaculaceae bacterium]
MYPFLKSLARAYAGRYGDPADFCFVFPGKRAGTFFLKHLRREASEAPMLAPRVMTISDMVSELADRVVAGRVDLLFRLYKAYRGLMKEDTAVDFDSFRGWGETVLSDFNEVDMYGVDAGEIFKNVKDYREIATDFLTEEQKRVMEEYFGRPVGGHAVAERFWRDFGSGDELSAVKSRFLYLWTVMGPLYDLLGDDLDRDGLATSGGIYRKALRELDRMLDEDLPTPFPGVRKMVFVGFNALSTVESRIFAAMTRFPDFKGPEGEEPFADFWWDATGPVLRSDDSSAARFVASNRRRFPEPEWAAPYLALSDTDTLPASMRVIAAPSGTIQAKLVSEELRRMRGADASSEAHFKDARVAVVLPDESLLLPLLYSLPEDLGEVNLTMGYPLRLTSAVSFVALLRRLLTRRRRTSRGPAYLREELRLILSHPFVHAVLGTDSVQNIKGELDRTRTSAITPYELALIEPLTERLFPAIDRDTPPAGVIETLDGVLAYIAESLRGAGGMVKSRLDLSHIAAYRDALARLRDAIERHGVDMEYTTVFSLADRFLAGELVTFEGEPLEGLQVMGMLETRALDFDRIIIPSLNERILPMKARARTFIPDSLRVAYGMPPANYQESLFAYYFYRMISRAEEVVMLYDARSGGGMRSGDVSRYLLQLKHLYAPQSLVWEERRFVVAAPGGTPQAVEKTPSVMALLREFTLSGDEARYLSASALMRYLGCPVRFYYEIVVGLRADPVQPMYIDMVTQGNIVHDVMMRLYLPEEMTRQLLRPGHTLSRSYILQRLGETERIDRLIIRAINREHFHRPDDRLDTPLEGEAAMVAGQLRRQVEGILRHDLSLAPFELYGTEVPGVRRLRVSDSLTVNMKFAIDRVDSVGEAGVRIVDYKTGAAHLTAEDMDGVFGSDYGSRHIFQLMLYANLLNLLGGRGWTEPVRMELYRPDNLPSDKPDVPKIGKQTLLSHTQADADYDPESPAAEEHGESFNGQFLTRLRSLIEEIFNPDRPFEPTHDERECRACPLSTLCRSAG